MPNSPGVWYSDLVCSSLTNSGSDAAVGGEEKGRASLSQDADATVGRRVGRVLVLVMR